MTTKVKIPMGLSVMNDKLQSLDMTLAKEMAEKQQHLSMCHNTMHVSFLSTKHFLKNIKLNGVNQFT